tara:strand:+ start:1151 stop:1414 length:264 start_codon:yes stop_codon:yes gene_type:complete
MTKLSRAIKALKEQTNLRQRDIAFHLQIKQLEFKGWISGEVIPTNDHLMAYAKLVSSEIRCLQEASWKELIYLSLYGLKVLSSKEEL